jgi:hypothetical protein
MNFYLNCHWFQLFYYQFQLCLDRVCGSCATVTELLVSRGIEIASLQGTY